MINKRFAFVFCLALFAFVFAKADQTYFQVDSIRYTELSPTTVSAAWASADKSGVVVVPSHISKDGKTYTVTSVGSYKFSNGFDSGSANKITTVKLPNTITRLGKWAFCGCKDLATIELPASLREIDYGAFNECSSLTEVVLPVGVTSIASHAFYKCSSLKKIVIPNTVTFVGTFAFDLCSSLEELDIPNSVTKLGTHFIDDCDNLRTLILPDKTPEKDVTVAWSIDASMVDYYYTYFFRGKSLETIKGHTLPFLAYVVDDMVNNDYKYAGYSVRGFLDAFEKTCESSPWANKYLRTARKTFTYYAGEKAMDEMAQWQQKKEYETTAQYKERMSLDNRKQQMTKIVDQLKKDFISSKTSKYTSLTLGKYDADYGTYPVSVNGITVYVKVPMADAPIFKEKINKVDASPTYDIVGDTLAITACTFKLKGKTYQCTQTYSNSSADNLLASLPPVDFDYPQDNAIPVNQDAAQTPAPVVMDNSVDINIPSGSIKSENTFAVIIGNEHYQTVAKVPYAANDAKVFAQYCQKTLGIPQKNIRSYSDATYGKMLAALKDIKSIANAYKGDLDVIFYYAGHGVPNENDQSAFLLPVDADGTQPEVCLSTKRLYQTLNELHARKVVVLMDACFSGAQRGDGMLASARGVALKVKNDVPTGNMVVFTAANGEQTAYPYKEKGHGLFTYYILKKLQDTKGNTTLGDLTDYVSNQVERQSVVENKHSQTPTVIPATSLSSAWRDMKLQ